MKIVFFILVVLFSRCILATDKTSGCHKLLDETKDYLHCLNQFSSYPEVVHVFIPKNLDPSQPINLNIHFHGHNIEGWDHFDKKFGDYGDFLAKSNKNSILVIPASTGKCTTYDQFFHSPQNGFKFLNETKLLFLPIKFGGISFSGHSGAYRVLNTIFGYDKLEDNLKLPVIGVGLFDATYGSTANIEDFAINKLKNGRSFLFYDSYVSGPKATAEALSVKLKNRIGQINLTHDSHFLDANKHCLDKINHSFFDNKIDSLSRPIVKMLIDQRFKFVPMDSKDFAPNSSILDLHFALIKQQGLSDFFKQLNSI